MVLPRPTSSGEQDAFRQRRRQREECGVHLMRVHIHAGGRKGLRQRVFPRAFQRDAVGEERALLRGVVGVRKRGLGGRLRRYVRAVVGGDVGGALVLEP